MKKSIHTLKIDLSKILVDFRNRWNKEYLLQLGEHFKYKNEKGLDICNKGGIVFVYEPNKKTADFKTGIIENFKSFQERKKCIPVIKCIIKWITATLKRPINRPILSRLFNT